MAGSLTDRNTAMQRFAQGYGSFMPFVTLATGATTGAGNTSGQISGALGFNSIGTTLLSTLVELQKPPVTGPLRASFGMLRSTVATNIYLVYLYKIGTLDLTATGDKFTHDAATFPVTRTEFGQATQPVNLRPLITVTTATATTAPAIQLVNVGGTTGYTNQDGNAVLGTITHTLPAAVTAINSTEILRLETTDSAVRDITSIKVTTAGTAGAATVWGAEILMPLGTASSSLPSIFDAFASGISLPDITPAVATSGTATSYLALWSQSSSTTTLNGIIGGILDT